MKVLVACEFSGAVRDAFIDRGHDAWSCDLLPSESRSERHITGDALKVLDADWDLLIAHPPCVYLAVTGYKWFYHPDDAHLPTNQRRPHPRFPNRREQQKEAIEFFMAFSRSDIPRIAIENPVGIMSTIWRKPDQIIQPFQFGHKEPKKTCLWLKGLPKLKATKIVEPDYITSKSGKRLPRWFFSPSPSEKRQKDRSRTFIGIAKAMAEQWGQSEKLAQPTLF